MLRMCLAPLVALLAPIDIAAAGSGVFPDGAYEIVSRLELPHLERWAVERKTRLCLSEKKGEGDIPIPVLSANTPFGQCAAANLASDGKSIAYDITCPGRASAKAHARYVVDQAGFSGRIDMVMAAKNMTMTEVVRARRVGDCGSQSSEAASAPGALATTH